MSYRCSITQHLFLLFLFCLTTSKFILAQGSEITVSSEINYNGKLHDYDLAGDEAGFHILMNNDGEIKHYLLGNDGMAVDGYTKIFEASGAVKASISSLNNKVFVIYRQGNDLKIWKSSDGGKSDSWNEGTPMQLTSTSLTSRISSSGYGFFIHVVWDNGEEVYYNRYNVNDDQWLTDNYNVTDFEEGEEGKGVEPDITVSESNGVVRIHVTYRNPANIPILPKQGAAAKSEYFYAAYNRDLLLPGGWKAEAEIVEQKSTDRMVYVYYSSPFICIYDDVVPKIISVFTYADLRETSPPGEEHHYYLNRYKSANVDDDVWSSFVGMAGNDENSCHEYSCFIESHYIFSDILNSPDSLFWALKYPDDNHLHLRKYENQTFVEKIDLGGGDYPKISANKSSSRFVTWKGTDNKIWVYRKSRPVSGGITENTMWSGDIYVSGDVTVNSGVTLTVLPGTVVTFSDGDDQSGGQSSTKPEIIVNGTFKADDALFTAAAQGDWYGIVFNSGASSSSYLDGCTIEKAYRGVHIDDCDLSLESTEIRDCSEYGLYIYNADPTIYNCYIHDTDDYGVAANNAGQNSFIQRTSIINCNGGVFIWGTANKLNMRGNASQSFGLNKIDSYTPGFGILITGGTPDLGEVFPITHRGKNDFIHGSSYIVKNTTSSEVPAEKNYWGGEPQSSWFYGWISYEPYYTSPQGGGSDLEKSAGVDEDKQLLAEANQLADDRLYASAVAKYKELIEKYPDSRYADLALAWAMAACNADGRLASQRAWLQEMTGHTNPKVAAKAWLWLQMLEARAGNKDAAAKIVDSISFDHLVGVEMRLNWINDLYNLYFDEESATAVISELAALKEEDDAVAATIEAIQKTARRRQEGESLPKVSVGAAKPNDFNLGNFPNPFNPTTNIRFHLPKESRVSLEIVDLLGRRVRRIVDQRMQAGSHIVPWDGRTDNGIEAAAGIYFARLRAGETTRTIKLLLVR